jgi:hypothetical protein
MLKGVAYGFEVVKYTNRPSHKHSRLPATAVAGIGALAVPSLVLLSMAGLGRLRRVKTPDEAEH